MKEFASAAIYESKLANGGSLPSIFDALVKSKNSSTDLIRAYNSMKTSHPIIP